MMHGQMWGVRNQLIPSIGAASMPVIHVVRARLQA